MYGRYGNDQFGRFLSVVALVLVIISFFVRSRLLIYIGFAVLAYQFFRVFSSNIVKRSAENQRFLDIIDMPVSFFRRAKQRREDTTHCYFKCPSCKKTLRVPKGRGKIQIHCPKCGRDFIKTT